MTHELDPELEAVKKVYSALHSLNDQQRSNVLKMVQVVQARPGSTLADAQTNASPSLTNPTLPPPPPSDGTTWQTPKDFLQAKKPTTEAQRITCLAYYLTHCKNQKLFKTSDLKKLNDEAGESPFSNPSMVVANATRSSQCLASAGGGQKRLTNRGEALVKALPDQQAVKNALGPRRKYGKRVRQRSSTPA